jgi:uncharacterized integral membrane protein
MVRKILAVVILVPLALAIVGLAVANRAVVTVSFDPFNPANPAYTLKAPLFVLALALLIAGVIVGGVAAWLKQRRWRRAARRFEADVHIARGEAEALRRRLEASEARPSAPPLALRPPTA